MREHLGRPFTFLTGALVVFVVIVVASLLFLNNYTNFVAESIGLISLFRVFEGLAHISEPSEIPSNLSPYGAYYYIILGNLYRYTLGFLFKDPYQLIIFLSRTLSFATFLMIIKMGCHFSHESKDFKRLGFVTTTIIFLAAYPIMPFMVRADWIAFGLEALGLFLLYDLWNQPLHKKRLFLIALVFSLAPQFKLNTIGLLLGAGLYLLWFKRFKSLTLLVIFTGFLTALGFTLSYLHLGANYLNQILHTANQGIVSLSFIPSLVTRIISDNFLKVIPLYAMATLAFVTEKDKRQQNGLLITASLTNFLLAGLFQFKIGAGNNYFIPSAIVLTPLMPIAMNKVRSMLPSYKKATAYFLVITTLATSLIGGTSLLAMTYNRLRYYPIQKVQNWLSKNYPRSFIYTTTPDMSVHLYKQTLIGPWDERSYQYSLFFKENFSEDYLQNLTDKNINLAVIPGSGCENWQRNAFASQFLKDKHQLVKKFGKICIFKEYPF